MVSKKKKIAAQIDALQAEYDTLNRMQEQYEASIRTMTGGYSTEDLIEKVVETTNSVDKNGNPVKITKFILKYPDTVVPPIQIPTNVEVNEEQNIINEEIHDSLYGNIE